MNFYRERSLLAVIFILGLLMFHASCSRGPVRVVPVSVRTADDIVDLDSNVIKPYDYKDVISLEELPVEIKKRKFIDMVLPAVLVAKERYRREFLRVDSLSRINEKDLHRRDKEFLEERMFYFNAENVRQLKLRLRTHPNSIVIAQAALESGWGTSRFFLEANNIFGVHSFDESHDRIEAGRERDGKLSYLKKYSSLSGSVEDYFRTIARGPYLDFRVHRARIKDPYILIQYLEKYSILGESYVYMLEEVMRTNQLTEYDDYRIDPRFLK